MTRGPRPPELLPETIHRVGEGRRFEAGHQYLRERFSEMQAEVARLNKHIVRLRETIQEISVDKPDGSGTNKNTSTQ